MGGGGGGGGRGNLGAGIEVRVQGVKVSAEGLLGLWAKPRFDRFSVGFVC